MQNNTKTIAFANQKGGVGKTTSCVNLAAALSMVKKKILLIDLDPQGNATMGSGFNKSEAKFISGDVLQGKVAIEAAIVSTKEFDLLPSNTDVTEAEVNLINRSNKEQQLLRAIKQIEHKYDFIFIDCPPSLNILTLNALIAAHSVIIPMQCEYYALEGLSSLISTIEDVNNINKQLRIEGIIRTMYDVRNRLCQDVSEQLIEHFGSLVYSTFIPRNIRLAEAPSYGMPVLAYDQNSKGSKAYLKLAKEFLVKQKNLHLKKKHREPELA